MKNSLIAWGLIMIMASAACAIDGAEGLGQEESKIEMAYRAGEVNLMYDFGLSRDLTVYGSILAAPGTTGFGVGAKYALLNEKKGNALSLAPKLDILIGGGGLFPVPGIVVSKKMNRQLTVLADFTTWAVQVNKVPISSSWVGAGVLYNIDKNFQLSGMLGVATVQTLSFVASGLAIALGLNYTL